MYNVNISHFIVFSHFYLEYLVAIVFSHFYVEYLVDPCDLFTHNPLGLHPWHAGHHAILWSLAKGQDLC